MTADLPAWRAALAFAAGAAGGEALLLRYWSMDPAAVPPGAAGDWRWLAAVACIAITLWCARVSWPLPVQDRGDYDAPLSRSNTNSKLVFVGLACAGLALSTARGAMLLGSPLRRDALLPADGLSSRAVQTYEVMILGVARSLDDVCYVRAEARETGACAASGSGKVLRVELVLKAAVAGVGEAGPRLLLPGSRLVCLARPYLPEPALNPYQYDHRAALAREGIEARLRVETLLEHFPRPMGPLQLVRFAAVRLAARCRARLEDLFERQLSPAGSALARALILGDRGRLDARQARAFERSGALHLMAVSGLHVGFLAGVVGFGCSAARVGGRARNAAVAAVTGLFALVTGAGPSVLRAAVMLNAGLWHPAGRRGNSLNSLGLAALVILAANPLQVADVGFQLSFAATAGIVAWAERAGRSVPERLRAGLLSSFGAQACSLPVQLNHFFRFAPWAPLNNLILLPLGGLVISALFAAACLGLAAPPLFAVLAWPIDALLRALAAAAQGLSGLPMSLVVTGQPSHWAILVALAAVGHIGLARRPEGRARWRVAATSAVLALLCLQAAWVHRPGPGLTVSFFAVGQGDAALVRCGKQAVLVDFGPPGPPGSAGSSRFSRCVLPYLHATRTFPSLGILSHPHADHIGGMADAMRQFPAMLVLTRECLEEASAAWVDAEELGLSARLAGMDREGTVVMPAGKVGGRGPQLVLELFWAPGLGRGAHVNELSCALRVYRRDGGAREGPDGRSAAVLFTGDLGHEAEAALVAGRAELLPGAVLKVGHHGSGGSTGERFLQAVSPALAVISVGHNGYGHPAPECLERLARAGVAVLRTDTAGWIRVRVDGEGIRVETFTVGCLQRSPAR